MKNIRTALTLLLVLSAVLVSSCSKKDDKSLVVAMELQFPPFEMADTDGTPTGISVEMAYALGEYLGRPVKIENTSWTGLIPSIQSAKADLVISSMSITDERAKVVDFSIPYAASGLTMLINKDSKVTAYKDLDRDGVVTAVKSGTIGAIWAQENLPQENIRIFDEVAACALEVSQGKVDAFIYDALTTFELQKKFPDSTMVNLENLPGTNGGWGVAMKIGSSLKPEVDAFILEYRNNGGFENLEKKYLTEIKEVFDNAGVPSFFDLKN
jgi:polar amino acid transport system substrate-binding protein